MDLLPANIASLGRPCCSVVDERKGAGCYRIWNEKAPLFPDDPSKGRRPFLFHAIPDQLASDGMAMDLETFYACVLRVTDSSYSQTQS